VDIRLCWYVAEKCLRDIRAKEEFSDRVLEGLRVMADFLVGQARLIERGTEAQRRDSKESVPADRIKDAPAVARELRWRVRQALDLGSDDDAGSSRRGSQQATSTKGNGTKRKRETSESGTPVLESYAARNFRNFRPKAWDEEVRAPVEGEKRVVKVVKSEDVPMGELVKLEASESDAESMLALAGGTEGEYETKSETIVRARRLAVDGRVVIERQRITRCLETWTLSQ